MYFLKELTAKEDPKLMRSFEEDKGSTAHISMFTYFTDVALVTTEKKGFMQLVNLKTGLFQTYLTHFDGGHIPRTGPLQFAALSPALYVAHRECHHVLYCLGTSNELLCGNFHTGQVAVVGEFSSRPSCVFADGEYAACGTSDGTIHLWRATTLLYDGYDLRYSPHPGDESIQKSFSFTGGHNNTSSNSRHNLSGAEAVLKVNDSGSILWRRKAHRSAIKNIQIDRDFMIVACADFTVAVHSLHGSGEQLASFQYDSHLTMGVVPLGPSAHRLAPSTSMGIDFGVLNVHGEMRMYGASSAPLPKKGGMTTDGVVGRIDHASNPGSNWEVLGAPLQLVEIDTSGGEGTASSPHHRFQQLTPTCITTRNGFVLVGTTEGFVVVYSVGPPTAGYPISELCVLNISATSPPLDGTVGGNGATDPITNIEVLADDHLVVLTKTGSVWRWPMSEVMKQAVPEAVPEAVEEDESYVNDRHHHYHTSNQFDEDVDHSGGYDTPTGEEEEAPPVARSTVRAPTPKDNTNNTNSSYHRSSNSTNNLMDTNMESYYHDPSGHAHESMALGSHIRAPFDFETNEHNHHEDGDNEDVEVVDMGAAESRGNTDYDEDDGATDASVAVPSTLRGAGKYAPSSVGVTFSESPSSICKNGGQRRNSNRQQHQDDDGAASGTNLGSDVRAIHNALRDNNNNEDASGRGGSSSRSPRSRVVAAVAEAAYDPQAYAAPSHMQVAIPAVRGLKEGRRADPRKVSALVSQLKDHADNTTHREGLFVPTSTVEEPDRNDKTSSGQVSPRDVDAYKIAHQLEVSAMRMRIAQQGGAANGGGYKRGDVYFADPELQSRIGELSHADSITGGGLLLQDREDHSQSSSPARTPSGSSPHHHRTAIRSAPSPPRHSNNKVVGSSPIGSGGPNNIYDGDQAGSSMDSGMLGSQAGDADASPSRTNRTVTFSPPRHPPADGNKQIAASPRGSRGVGPKSSPPVAPVVDDLVDATFLQYARKVDAEYERKRTVPGPNIHAHLCDVLLHPHLAPTHLGHVSALEDRSSSSPNTPSAPPAPTRIGALKKLSTFAPLSDVTGRVNNSSNNKVLVGSSTSSSISKVDSKVAAIPATTTTPATQAPPPQYVPDIVFFFEPEMRWSASKGTTTVTMVPAPRLMGQTAFLTADESNTLFGKDPFDESALPGLELPLGTML